MSKDIPRSDLGTEIQIDEETKEEQRVTIDADRAIREFTDGSLYNHTNQFGTDRNFKLAPGIAAACSAFPYPRTLVDAKHPVQDFWVYDGAYPGVTDRGKIATDRQQVLPDKRITEQDAVEWQRVGSKKGWMFNGPPQQNKPGFSGENFPTHTSDGFIDQVRKHKWYATPRSAEKQGLATRDMPAIDIENNARGIGVTGPGSGNGGMAGGYQQINPARLAALPVPNARFNWTGTRVAGTAREDQGGGELGSGAGGYRAGYASKYQMRPVYPVRRSTGLSRVTQNAA